VDIPAGRFDEHRQCARLFSRCPHNACADAPRRHMAVARRWLRSCRRVHAVVRHRDRCLPVVSTSRVCRRSQRSCLCRRRGAGGAVGLHAQQSSRPFNRPLLRWHGFGDCRLRIACPRSARRRAAARCRPQLAMAVAGARHRVLVRDGNSGRTGEGNWRGARWENPWVTVREQGFLLRPERLFHVRRGLHRLYDIRGRFAETAGHVRQTHHPLSTRCLVSRSWCPHDFGPACWIVSEAASPWQSSMAYWERPRSCRP
jgi:hypothetical protein